MVTVVRVRVSQVPTDVVLNTKKILVKCVVFYL